MELQHINAKLFAHGEPDIDLERVIEIFHHWVAEQSLDELSIDVADYRHVPSGPSVLLVALQADYILDNSGPRIGLVYNRKAPLDGNNVDRLRQALMSAALAAERLESEFAGLRFDRSQFQIIVNDRAIAPNTPETYAACRPDIEAFVNQILGQSSCELTHHADSRSRFSVSVQLPQPIDFAVLSAA